VRTREEMLEWAVSALLAWPLGRRWRQRSKAMGRWSARPLRRRLYAKLRRNAIILFNQGKLDATLRRMLQEMEGS